MAESPARAITPAKTPLYAHFLALCTTSPDCNSTSKLFARLAHLETTLYGYLKHHSLKLSSRKVPDDRLIDWPLVQGAVHLSPDVSGVGFLYHAQDNLANLARNMFPCVQFIWKGVTLMKEMWVNWYALCYLWSFNNSRKKSVFCQLCPSNWQKQTQLCSLIFYM